MGPFPHQQQIAVGQPRQPRGCRLEQPWHALLTLQPCYAGDNPTIRRDPQRGTIRGLRGRKSRQFDPVGDYHELVTRQPRTRFAPSGNRLAHADVAVHPLRGHTIDPEVPSPRFGYADSGEHSRHACLARRNTSHDIRVKQESLHKMRVLCAQQSFQATDDSGKLPPAPAAEITHLDTSRFERFGAPRVPARWRRKAVDHRRKTRAVQSRGQLDETLLSPADVQIGDTQCDACWLHDRGGRQLGSPATNEDCGLYSFQAQR